MNTIKFIGKNIIRLNGIEYKGYNVGELPPSFGFKQRLTGNGDIQEGISKWFNYKGLTYVPKSDNPWA